VEKKVTNFVFAKFTLSLPFVTQTAATDGISQ